MKYYKQLLKNSFKNLKKLDQAQMIFGIEIEFHLFAENYSSNEIYDILIESFKNKEANLKGLEIKKEDEDFQFEICLGPSHAVNLVTQLREIRKYLKKLAQSRGLILSYVKKAQFQNHNSLHVHFNFSNEQNLDDLAGLILHDLRKNLKIFAPHKLDLLRFKLKKSMNSPQFICIGSSHNRTCAIRSLCSLEKKGANRMELRVASARSSLSKILVMILHLSTKQVKIPPYNKIYAKAEDVADIENLQRILD